MSDALMTQPVDLSEIFHEFPTMWFTADELTAFNPDHASGTVRYLRHRLKPRMAFNMNTQRLAEDENWEFPPAYPENPELSFKVEFYSESCVRLKLLAKKAEVLPAEVDSLMLLKEASPVGIWPCEVTEQTITYKSTQARLVIYRNPFVIEWQDATGKVLTRTNHLKNSKSLTMEHPVPLSFARDIKDLSRVFAASWSLAPDEKIVGGGESFTRLDKRGQKLILQTTDSHGVHTEEMYKPVPFMISNRGYGMFYHTGARMTWDLGKTDDIGAVNFIDEAQMDLFLYAGDPKQVIAEHTALTGKAETPPLWSLGLWMSRITYKSEAEAREVAAKLIEHKIPCDVIHLDTGWFETDWCCDYQFSHTRFDDAGKLMDDLKEMGYRVSLWQLPYITPTNPLYPEAVEQGLAIKDPEGGIGTEDVILDFTNPDTIEWFQDKLAGVLNLGAECIKVDFGESGPIDGRYANGRSGHTEHNLYPLRYNKVVSDITRETRGHSLIWARSAWAGSQRYATHWGGDAENTNNGMLCSLRGGLSLGLSGFSFWSHDIGGFAKASEPELYLRWLFMGIFTSHSRCHGFPPKEPWHFGEQFTEDFRKVMEWKYKLMPYVYAQAADCAKRGVPMLRAMLLDYPEDRIAWMVEDQYLFGNDLLIAPLFEANQTSREVYLPKGNWHDLFTGEVYEGAQMLTLSISDLPGIALVKEGTALPMVEVALTTDAIDWEAVEWKVFGESGEGLFFKPGMSAVELIKK